MRAPLTPEEIADIERQWQQEGRQPFLAVGWPHQTWPQADVSTQPPFVIGTPGGPGKSLPSLDTSGSGPITGGNFASPENGGYGAAIRAAKLQQQQQNMLPTRQAQPRFPYSRIAQSILQPTRQNRMMQYLQQFNDRQY